MAIPLVVEFTMKLVTGAKVEGTSFVFTNNCVYFQVRKCPGCGSFPGLGWLTKQGVTGPGIFPQKARLLLSQLREGGSLKNLCPRDLWHQMFPCMESQPNAMKQIWVFFCVAYAQCHTHVGGRQWEVSVEKSMSSSLPTIQASAMTLLTE